MSTTISIPFDSASPAIANLVESVSPEKLAANVGPACADLMRRHYYKRGANKKGYPSTGFWGQAADATRWERAPSGVVVITDKLGVRQRLLGGTIKPVNKKKLAIPANALAYGKTPAEFATLHFVKFGRGQSAPQALVMLGNTATHITPKRGKKGGFKPTAEEIGTIVMFWLKDKVEQKPDPNVIPTDAQFQETIAKAIEPLLKTK